MFNKEKKGAVETQDTAMVPQTDGSAALAINNGPQRGFEAGEDKDDLIIPRAQLIQSTSEEIKQGIEGFKVGMIVNSLTKEQLPDVFIPILAMPKTFIRWNPRKQSDPNYDSNFDPGALIWRSNDPLDPRVVDGIKFGPNGEPPAVTRYINYLVWFVGYHSPIILSFSKTSYDAGRNLYSLAKLSGGDIFNRKYKLISKDDTNKAGDTFKVLKVSPAGVAEPNEYKTAEMLWKEFSPRTKDIKVQEDAPEEVAERKPWH